VNGQQRTAKIEVAATKRHQKSWKHKTVKSQARSKASTWAQSSAGSFACHLLHRSWESSSWNRETAAGSSHTQHCANINQHNSQFMPRLKPCDSERGVSEDADDDAEDDDDDELGDKSGEPALGWATGEATNALPDCSPNELAGAGVAADLREERSVQIFTRGRTWTNQAAAPATHTRKTWKVKPATGGNGAKNSPKNSIWARGHW
jgi:hypothetical protein